VVRPGALEHFTEQEDLEEVSDKTAAAVILQVQEGDSLAGTEEDREEDLLAHK